MSMEPAYALYARIPRPLAIEAKALAGKRRQSLAALVQTLLEQAVQADKPAPQPEPEPEPAPLITEPRPPGAGPEWTPPVDEYAHFFQ